MDVAAGVLVGVDVAVGVLVDVCVNVTVSVGVSVASSTEFRLKERSLCCSSLRTISSEESPSTTMMF